MLTLQGFRRRRYADFIEIMNEQAKQIFGADVNLSERSPLGKFIQLIAYQRAEDEELAEAIWNSAFVDTAEGISLDHAVKRGLITRKQATKASGNVKVNVLMGTTIPKGTLFSTPYNVLFQTLEDFTANQSGDFLLPVEAVEYGEAGNVEANEITVVVNPINGLNSVTNPEPFRNGQDEETDEELRKRYYDSLGKNGNRRTETIRSRILDEVQGVRSCLVIENNSPQEDADGRPPHSFETIVLGGEAEDIAQVILEAKPLGIRPYGQEQVEVTDSQGMTHTIGFTYADVVPIFVRVKVKKGLMYPIDGDDQIIQQVVQFIGGVKDNIQYNGLGMSEPVIHARLQAAIFNVIGVEDVEVQLSTDGVNYVEENIPIGFAQVAETDPAKIEVSELV